MRSLKQTITLERRSPFKIGPVRTIALRCILLTLIFFVTVNTIAQTAPPTASDTLLATGFSLPYGAQVLNGSAINPATGKPFRHVWTADTTD